MYIPTEKMVTIFKQPKEELGIITADVRPGSRVYTCVLEVLMRCMYISVFSIVTDSGN